MVMKFDTIEIDKEREVRKMYNVSFYDVPLYGMFVYKNDIFICGEYDYEMDCYPAICLSGNEYEIGEKVNIIDDPTKEECKVFTNNDINKMIRGIE